MRKISNKYKPFRKGHEKVKKMNRRYEVLMIFLITVLAVSNYQMVAQSMDNKSNGTLEILSIDLPDSILFKPADGVKLKDFNVSLVSGTNRIKPGNYVANKAMLSDEGGPVFSENARLYAMSFEIPADFKVEKIRFEVDGKEMYFDIAKYEWEPESENTPVESPLVVEIKAYGKTCIIKNYEIKKDEKGNTMITITGDGFETLTFANGKAVMPVYCDFFSGGRVYRLESWSWKTNYVDFIFSSSVKPEKLIFYPSDDINNTSKKIEIDLRILE